ncbi:MAG TPA: hypothetical protein VFW48_05390 [Solirubrobacterales bacterium]|nr:hypothetical protein [Solirubrobacterales bacterium]
MAAARRAGKVGTLPESPQHREWRHAREDAEARYDDFRTLVYETLEAAEAAMEPAAGPDSETLFELSERLRAAFWLLGSATYCRDEWAEPEDARMDREPSHHPTRGMRRTTEWEANKKRAKGGSS